MAIDLKLPSNEVVLITQDDVTMPDRKDVQGFGSNPFDRRGSGIVKKSQRYNLNEFMKNPNGLLSSPSPSKLPHRLKAETL